MPDHFHALITPLASLEKAMQFIQGGFSFGLQKETGYLGEVWQRGFTDHRIRDSQDFAHHLSYIHHNPVERKMVDDPSEYRYCSAFPGFELDPWPSAAKAEISKSA
jgi:putative transposase